MQKIVSNASPIISLAKLNYLQLLTDYEILIPSIVHEELLAKESAEKDRLKNFFSWKNVSLITLKKIKAFSKALGRGELAVLQLALEKKIPSVLFDDRRARALASVLTLQPKGTLWILANALRRGRIDKKQFRVLIFDLIAHGFYIDEKLLVKILKSLESTP